MPHQHHHLPIAPLLALATAGFITILTEALPAGLLPEMARDLAVSQAWAGQTITAYAMGSLMAAAPLTAATQGARRRPLLLWALAGFVLANTVTAVSQTYLLTMAARFLAGVAAGLLWALLAGYAARMAPAPLKGRAIAVAMVGTPLALCLGIPAATFLGQLLGWRLSFAGMSALALMLMGWVRIQVPDFPGQPRQEQASFGRVLRMPDIRAALFVVLAFVLAHNLLYTYITPLLAGAGMDGQVGTVLLVFGAASLFGIAGIGGLIDQHLRALTLGTTGLFFLGALLLGFASQTQAVVYVAVALWGLAFGGAATLFQTAMAQMAGSATDIAQSMLVTAWNAAIAVGAMLGGGLLSSVGACALAPVAMTLLLAVGMVVHKRKRYGQPPA